LSRYSFFWIGRSLWAWFTCAWWSHDPKRQIWQQMDNWDSQLGEPRGRYLRGFGATTGADDRGWGSHAAGSCRFGASIHLPSCFNGGCQRRGVRSPFVQGVVARRGRCGSPPWKLPPYGWLECSTAGVCASLFHHQLRPLNYSNRGAGPPHVVLRTTIRLPWVVPSGPSRQTASSGRLDSRGDPREFRAGPCCLAFLRTRRAGATNNYQSACRVHRPRRNDGLRTGGYMPATRRSKKITERRRGVHGMQWLTDEGGRGDAGMGWMGRRPGDRKDETLPWGAVLERKQKCENDGAGCKALSESSHFGKLLWTINLAAKSKKKTRISQYLATWCILKMSLFITCTRKATHLCVASCPAPRQASRSGAPRPPIWGSGRSGRACQARLDGAARTCLAGTGDLPPDPSNTRFVGGCAARACQLDALSGICTVPAPCHVPQVAHTTCVYIVYFKSIVLVILHLTGLMTQDGLEAATSPSCRRSAPRTRRS